MASRKGRRSVDSSLASLDKDLAAWAKAMSEARDGLDKVPAGWFSIVELAKKFGMADSAMTPHLRRLMEAGKAEKKKFYEGRTTDGRRYKKTYYRLK